MNLRSILSIKNKDFFAIRSFVFVFALYSIISIGFTYHIENQDRRLSQLSDEVKVLKVRYVNYKTHLMSLTKQSFLLKKAESFQLYRPTKAVKNIELEL